MKQLLGIAAGLMALLAASSFAAAEDTLRLELNTTEAVQNRCRTSFLIENKSDRQIESFKIDLVIFGLENTMQRRTAVELGPLRRAKTIMRTFEFERECAQIGAILVNDVTACAPGEPGACLDQLTLSSRVPSVRLFK